MVFRPMLRKNQALAPERITTLLKEEKCGVLSLIGDGGYPYGIPMDHLYDDKTNRLYFHCGKTGHKLDAIRACDKASYCVTDQGFIREGDWARNVSSVVLFGRIRILEDPARIEEICRALSRRFTDDEVYVQNEICRFLAATLCLELTIEHVSGKLVNES